ncbi:MAG: hypothetical protein K8L99_36295 [Anaerolineae bacterium]|nr:hypothetical protein [Anaerolineae bacterium]
MRSLRRWSLQSSMPFSLPLAADARLTTTDYLDDQVWELHQGDTGSPALALQTRYGGRVGLASIVPMWVHEGRSIYEAQAYAHPPVITAFAPGYLRVQGSLTLNLAVQAEYWVIDSHTIAGCFTLGNAHIQPTTVQLSLLGHVGAQGKDQPLHIFDTGDGAQALHMGKIGNINPVVLLEKGTGTPGSQTLSREIELGSRKKIMLRWVHAGLSDIRDSLAQAQFWLGKSWKPFFEQIERAATAIPDIETGDEALDATIATAYQQLVLACLKPTSSLPHASIVGLRKPGTGFSPRGDGTHPWREWNGQSPTAAYLAASGLASIDALLAQGVIQNYLAIQQPDGAVDWKPGLGGQRQGILCMPILARLAWGVFQYTEDETFLRDVFPGLRKFFDHWLTLDADGDGLPEWQSENQTGYIFWPTFAVGQSWGENLDIAKVETPDLLAYLLSEAISLQAIAYYLHDSSAEQALAKLRTALEALWIEGRYSYRDRDTHLRTSHHDILSGGRGDEEHILALPLEPASHLVVHVEGGVDHTPRLKMQIDGLDAEGQPIREVVESAAFFWQQNRGAYSTERIFSQVDRVHFDGLSRVYRISLSVADLTRLDINALLPLWSVGISPERAEGISKLATDPAHFWRANGITMTSAQDANFDPANANGSGGIWPFWLTLMGEGFIEAGKPELAADLLQRLLRVQVETLRQQREFSEFYHSEETIGLGEKGHLAGIVPLHLLLRVLGIRVIHSGKVWTGGPYFWPQPVKLTQHGVTIQRSAQGTQIHFPSGHEVTLDADAEWQEVIDPQPKPVPPPKTFQAIAKSLSSQRSTSKKQ